MKPSGELFLEQTQSRDLEWTTRKNRGDHEAGGRAQGVGAPPASWTPHLFLDVHSKSSGSRLFQK